MTTRSEYINELRKVRTQLQAFVLLPEDMHLDFTDEEMAHIDKVIQRGEELADILEAIDAALESFQHEAQRHALPAADLGQVIAQKSDTLQLMEQVARHLSGRDLDVQIDYPRNNHEALCIWNGPAAKSEITIKIHPRAVEMMDHYLDVFLHEVAHAKLHTPAAVKADREQAEREAIRQSRYWTHYAKTHSLPMDLAPDRGGSNVVSNYFRYLLYTLLDSQEAAERVVG